MVRSLTQAGTTRTWSLDPNRRLRVRTDTGATGTRTSHYDSDGDSPAWIAENAAATAWTRNIGGVDGDLAAIQDSAAGTTLQLGNLHGDVVATASLDPTATGPLATFGATEFGIPRTTPGAHYGWLGEKQRETDSLTGVVLMGVRLYVPTLGRFLQTDPVPGGSANDYDYANQDPVIFDLDGTMAAPQGSGICHYRWGECGGVNPAFYANRRSMWRTAKFLSWFIPIGGGLGEGGQPEGGCGEPGAYGGHDECVRRGWGWRMFGRHWKFAYHGSHHYFPRLRRRMYHFQLNWYRRGVKGSGGKGVHIPWWKLRD